MSAGRTELDQVTLAFSAVPRRDERQQAGQGLPASDFARACRLPKFLPERDFLKEMRFLCPSTLPLVDPQ